MGSNKWQFICSNWWYLSILTSPIFASFINRTYPPFSSLHPPNLPHSCICCVRLLLVNTRNCLRPSRCFRFDWGQPNPFPTAGFPLNHAPVIKWPQTTASSSACPHRIRNAPTIKSYRNKERERYRVIILCAFQNLSPQTAVLAALLTIRHCYTRTKETLLRVIVTLIGCPQTRTCFTLTTHWV